MRPRIKSLARSAIAIRTEFGLPEMGVGNILESIILSLLTPFTLKPKDNKLNVFLTLKLCSTR